METPERILKETWRLMEAHRGMGVRVEDIARAAGVSRQAVYLHFGSRAGLLTATARYLDQQMDHPSRSRPIFEAKNGEEALEAFVQFWSGYLLDIYGLAKALLLAKESDEAAAAAWTDRMEALYEKCRWVIGRIEADYLLADGWTTTEATDFMWSLIAVDMWEHLTLEKGWSQEQYTRRILQSLKAVLLKATVTEIQ